MKIGELATLCGVSTTTIQNWTAEFGDYLSDQAKKIHTRQRSFTESDVLTAATIAKLSHEGLNYDAIRERLNAGERVEHPGVANFGVDTRMIPAAAMEQMIDATEIRVELEQVKADRDKLTELLEKSEAHNTSLHEKVDALQKQIADLQRELGRLEGRLEEKDKRRRWF